MEALSLVVANHLCDALYRNGRRELVAEDAARTGERASPASVPSPVDHRTIRFAWSCGIVAKGPGVSTFKRVGRSRERCVAEELLHRFLIDLEAQFQIRTLCRVVGAGEVVSSKPVTL